jgi:hypothetical protein
VFQEQAVAPGSRPLASSAKAREKRRKRDGHVNLYHAIKETHINARLERTRRHDDVIAFVAKSRARIALLFGISVETHGNTVVAGQPPYDRDLGGPGRQRLAELHQWSQARNAGGGEALA